MNGLGIGLSQRPDMLDTIFFDLFDVNHQFSLHFGDGKSGFEDESANPTALGLVRVGALVLSRWLVGRPSGSVASLRALFA